jgi:hypothetical protein
VEDDEDDDNDDDDDGGGKRGGGDGDGGRESQEGVLAVEIIHNYICNIFYSSV